MSKPNPEFEIDEPTDVDDLSRSPNKDEVIDPDAHEMEVGTERTGQQGISNRPNDEEDEDATDDSAIDDGEEGTSASDKGETGNLGRDAGATQGSQKMTRPDDRSRQDSGQNRDQQSNESGQRSTQGGQSDRAQGQSDRDRGRGKKSRDAS